MPIYSQAVPCSSIQGYRKLVRRLFTKLKHTQAVDFPIPNPTIFEIKFYMKNNSDCCRVFVESDDTPLYQYPFMLFDCVPRFISSQLEAQKITDDYRQSAQLSTVLVVISEYLVVNPFRTPSVPTLFSWREADRRRTFYLFAYLSHMMEGHTYTPAELLGLRPSQASKTSHEVLEKLKADPEFNGVVSKDSDGSTQAQTRGSKKPKGISSSSNETDEVVYRGKNLSRHSGHLGQPGAAAQWKYRGRTGSEATSSDPLSAPTGLDKQSSEGFQRFFKAVVSPTHVRVTAGGRIVPNTRNSASPTTKWDQERIPVDIQNPVEPTKDNQAESVFAAANGQLPPPLVPPVYQAQPVIYQHMGMPIPFYHPLQNGLAYPYSFATLPTPAPSTSYVPMSESEQRAQFAGNGGNEKDSGPNDNKPQRAPIKISPPDHFDQNRPFYVGGQLVFPSVGMGQGPMHHMGPSPYFAPGLIPTTAQTDPRLVALNQPGPNIHVANGSTMSAPSQQYSSAPNKKSASQQAAASTGSAAAPPTGIMPPLSSIRPSEITRKQLEGLRSSLKYYVSQLQFNKHQIDEPWVFAQAQKVRDNIKQFEHNLSMQIRYELEHYPNMEPTPRHISEMTLPCNVPSRPVSVRRTRASGSSHHGSIKSGGNSSGPKRSQSHQGSTGTRGSHRPNRTAVGINSNRTDNSTTHIDAFEEAVIQKLSSPDATPEEKAMLEVLTRPLNPNYDSKSSAEQQRSSDNSSLKDSAAHLKSSRGKESFRGQSKRANVYAQNQRGNGQTAQPSGVYPGNGSTPYIAPLNGNGTTVPYLIGNYPPGADPWTYQGPEFVYTRELTDIEKQARNIYWGKLPTKGTGLPKFDGKDFYPPSPQKAVGAKSQIPNTIAGQLGGGPGFEMRHSEIDPFRSNRHASSIRSHGSGRKLSKAIPIVAPPDVDKDKTGNTPTTSKQKRKEGAEELEKTNSYSQGVKPSSQGDSSTKYSEKKSPSLSRRALERSSVKSGHDLWQSMLKKGSTSGSALPGAVSSTTATGYLPQYAGNAIASLGPTLSNGSPARAPPNADDKLVELEGSRVTMDKAGENCPPSSAPSVEHNITRDLHDRMLRDAERRGVVGSDWQ